MSSPEPPTGKLMWGQAGAYDAINDRAVISALASYETGWTRAPVVVPGTGLNLTVRGGWLGITPCGDGTSGVVGALADSTVPANPGSGSTSRTDYLWCDVNADDGVFELRVVSPGETTNRPGLRMATIVVPSTANSAAQMTITSAGVTLGRRLLAVNQVGNDQVQVSPATWAAANFTNLEAPEILLEPGHQYRVVAFASSMMVVSGAGREGRLGIGWRASGIPVTGSAFQQSAALRFAGLNMGESAICEWVFRHAADQARIGRIFDTRCWLLGGGSFTSGGFFNEGHTRRITVEDMGP